jgi:hypothetical protein
MMPTAFVLYFPFLVRYLLIGWQYIRNELTTKYGLSAKHREKYPVTRVDLNILIQHLYTSDTHDYVHERGRFQQAFGLSLFSSSGARAGAIVESSAYRDTNEALYYQVNCFQFFLLNRLLNASIAPLLEHEVGCWRECQILGYDQARVSKGSSL